MVASTGATAETMCPAGRYSGAAASYCAVCPAGTTNKAGEAACTVDAPAEVVLMTIRSSLALNGVDASAFNDDAVANAQLKAALEATLVADLFSFMVDSAGIASVGPAVANGSSPKIDFELEANYTAAAGEDLMSTEELVLEDFELDLLAKIEDGTLQRNIEEACPLGYYSNLTGQSSCQLCETPTTTLEEGKTYCDACREAYYWDSRKYATHADKKLLDGNGQPLPCKECCVECDDACEGGVETCANCPQGARTTLETMDLKKNFWRASIDATSIYECIFEESCKGGANSSCAAPQGPGRCKAHYFYDTAANRCVDCGNKIKASGDNIIGTVLAGEAVKDIAKAKLEEHYEDDEDGEAAGSDTQSADDKESSGRSMEQNVMTKAKIVIATYQIACSIPWSLPQVRFPTIFKEALKLGSVVNLSFISFAKTECFGDFDYFDKLLFVTLLPVVFVLLIAVGFAIRYACVDRSRRDEILSGASYWILFTLYVLVPSTSAYCLRYFACAKYDGGYGDGVNVMRIDPTISCDSPSYDAWLPYVLFSIVAYPVGVPLGRIAIGLLGSLISYRVFSHYEPYVEEDDGVVSEVAQTELVLVFFYALMVFATDNLEQHDGVFSGKDAASRRFASSGVPRQCCT
ncbi:hypothetical protein JL721_12730 [Aureococcus anophagefferens]|nr:hypothetical protein JL721_12730 [Aureococcus anophagefferens]